MGLTDISWPGLFIGVPAPNLFYWGSRPKPRRCAKLSRKPTLLSLRGRLMAGEWQGSSDGKVTGRGGLSILGFHPKPRRCAKPSRKPTRLSLRGRLMPFLLGFHPKPRRFAKPSRKPTRLSLRGRLMAGEWPGSSDGKVTGRGGLSILGLHPKPRRCAKPSRRPNPAFASRPPDGGESARFKHGNA